MILYQDSRGLYNEAGFVVRKEASSLTPYYRPGSLLRGVHCHGVQVFYFFGPDKTSMSKRSAH